MKVANCAEYVINAGNPRVILCERGIRTLNPIRNCLDVGAIPIVKSQALCPLSSIHPTREQGLCETIGQGWHCGWSGWPYFSNTPLRIKHYLMAYNQWI